MPQPAASRRAEVVNFDEIAPVPCPCGEARRAFAAANDYPGTVHRTDISSDARVHYHKRLTEVHYILECESDARMELDGEQVPISPGTCIRIPPLVRHRAVGQMRVLVIVNPKFDPADEWFD